MYNLVKTNLSGKCLHLLCTDLSTRQSNVWLDPTQLNSKSDLRKKNISKTITLNPGISGEWALIVLSQDMRNTPVQCSLSGPDQENCVESKAQVPAHSCLSLPGWPSLPFPSGPRLAVMSTTL